MYSQNWNVFNKNYRYNYKYNNSVLVSNVLFVDTVKQAGADTIYTLNRIGVECTGSCPTITTALSPGVNYIVPNMPQFLQRNILKYSNGLVKLYDTTKIVIIPTCSLTQTWLFDSVYNKTATCVNISTLNIFGNTDSVKTILIQNVDTLLLSKSFGIILFPDIYAKNKYFRLTGIEKRNSYDLTALFGEKVPNAWDFYNYDVGDKFCREKNRWWLALPNIYSSCIKEKVAINFKSNIAGGYIYNVDRTIATFTAPTYAPNICTYPLISFTTAVTNPTLVYNKLSKDSLRENRMYPNMICQNFGFVYNIVKFGLDNTGRFYKYAGRPCNTYSVPMMPNSNAVIFIEDPNNNGYFISYNNGQYRMGLCFGVGLGLVTETLRWFETENNDCLSSATKSTTTFFGTCFDEVGIEEFGTEYRNSIIYPNPASNTLHFKNSESCHVQIINTFGQFVFSSNIEPKQKIDVSTLAEGVYLINVKSQDFSYRQKLVISR